MHIFILITKVGVGAAVAYHLDTSKSLLMLFEIVTNKSSSQRGQQNYNYH